jgi:3-deoxy-D-manno-octulosonic-acid transferase
MPYLLDLLYLLALLVLSPWLLYKTLTTGKYRRGIWSKLFGSSHLVIPSPRHPVTPSPPYVVTPSPRHPVAWFHGVSVGEIHLLRSVVAGFRKRHPDWDCVISTTTDTGFDEACKRFPGVPVFYWPFDFSWAVRRALRHITPALVVLAEGELWPNFVIAAKERGIPVAVINGRMSPRSFRRFARLRRLVGSLLRRVDLFAVQTEEFARCYCALGAVPERVQVTGSVKYDGIAFDRRNSRTQELRRLLAVNDSDLIWIAGSTQAPEEEIALKVFGRLKLKHPDLRLLLVPRQKERFDEVAALLQRSGHRFLRRSNLSAQGADRFAVILVDTIGELGALWGLADVAFVGGSLDGRRGGQNMIEPAGYGVAVVFGPHVWNFRDTGAALVEAGAAIQIPDADALELAVERVLRDPQERRRLGSAAQDFVRSRQGATERTLKYLDQLLDTAVEPSPWRAPHAKYAKSDRREAIAGK